MSEKPKSQSSRTLSKYLLLHFAVFVLALGTVCSKFAANQEFMSFGFIALYAGVIGTLAISFGVCSGALPCLVRQSHHP